MTAPDTILQLAGKLAHVVGQSAVHDGEDAKARVSGGWARVGKPALLVRPGSTDDVAACLALCAQSRVPVVPVGGKTGVVSGARADDMVALSLERMNRVERIDRDGMTLTAQAGCTIQQLDDAAAEHGLMFPLDLGARGSATVGGAISTNAGGNRVLRFGMMREMVLGLEVALVDGKVISAMNGLIKNNAGYDLKQLFIGSEGTLGVVTRAVLRLRPRPVTQHVALAGARSFEDVVSFKTAMERRLGGTLSAFEVMWSDFYQLVTTPPARGRRPLEGDYPYYVLIEALGGDERGDRANFEAALAEALDGGMIADAVMAKSKAECDELWALREDVEQTGRNRPVYSFDVSLPIREMEQYVADVRHALAGLGPTPTLVVFGHLGDGNLHLIAGVGESGPMVRQRISCAIYDPLAAFGGSISAEHGIGLEKRQYLDRTRSAREVEMMRLLKQTLDPGNLLNPGKVFTFTPDEESNQS